jgi:hypothetical protein
MHQEWVQFRRRRLIYNLCGLAWHAIIVAGAAGIAFLFTCFPNMPADLVAIIVVGSLVLMIVVSNALRMFDPRRSFRCPRCRKHFFAPWEKMPFILNTRRCFHCGLPKWADPEQDEEAHV